MYRFKLSQHAACRRCLTAAAHRSKVRCKDLVRCVYEQRRVIRMRATCLHSFTWNFGNKAAETSRYLPQDTLTLLADRCSVEMYEACRLKVAWRVNASFAQAAPGTITTPVAADLANEVRGRRKLKCGRRRRMRYHPLSKQADGPTSTTSQWWLRSRNALSDRLDSALWPTPEQKNAGNATVREHVAEVGIVHRSRFVSPNNPNCRSQGH
jgi:hypothetical protein